MRPLPPTALRRPRAALYLALVTAAGAAGLVAWAASGAAPASDGEPAAGRAVWLAAALLGGLAIVLVEASLRTLTGGPRAAADEAAAAGRPTEEAAESRPDGPGLAGASDALDAPVAVAAGPAPVGVPAPVAARALAAPAAPAAPNSASSALAEALQSALDQGALRLVYQPVIDLADQRVHAVEALLRWPQAPQQMVSTAELVAAAEAAGLGPAIGRFVLAGACRQLQRWQQVLGAAAPPRVSVNLTRSQCLDDDLLPRLQALLAEHGLASSVLGFEVAESLAVGDQAVVSRLRALRALGCGVVLDHFGATGSSLGALHALPADMVKIDRGFVQRAEGGDMQRMVVQSIVRVAGSLGLAVAAEGVETAAQLALLRELGCRLAQGHALSAPLDAFALTRRLRAGGAHGQGGAGGDDVAAGHGTAAASRAGPRFVDTTV